jgi:hypothetical protein
MFLPALFSHVKLRTLRTMQRNISMIGIDLKCNQKRRRKVLLSARYCLGASCDRGTLSGGRSSVEC